MDSYILGIALMIAGVIIYVLGRILTRRANVHAGYGSVAVGGNNTGSIVNINNNKMPKNSTSSHTALTIVAIAVELAGIATMLWHAAHMASK